MIWLITLAREVVDRHIERVSDPLIDWLITSGQRFCLTVILAIFPLSSGLLVCFSRPPPPPNLPGVIHDAEPSIRDHAANSTTAPATTTTATASVASINQSSTAVHATAAELSLVSAGAAVHRQATKFHWRLASDLLLLFFLLFQTAKDIYLNFSLNFSGIPLQAPPPMPNLPSFPGQSTFSPHHTSFPGNTGQNGTIPPQRPSLPSQPVLPTFAPQYPSSAGGVVQNGAMSTQPSLNPSPAPSGTAFYSQPNPSQPASTAVLPPHPVAYGQQQQQQQLQRPNPFPQQSTSYQSPTVNGNVQNISAPVSNNIYFPFISLIWSFHVVRFFNRTFQLASNLPTFTPYQPQNGVQNGGLTNKTMLVRNFLPTFFFMFCIVQFVKFSPLFSN